MEGLNCKSQKPPIYRVLVSLAKYERCSSLLTLDNAKASFALCSLNRSLVP